MNGFLYIAAGDEHVEEALTSVRSLRKVEPEAKVHLVTEKLRPHLELFDVVSVRTGVPSIAYKVDNLHTPFTNTCFVDSDTYFTASVKGVFEVLDSWDMAMMPDPVEIEMQPGVVAFNTGVIFMKNNLKVETCLNLMRAYYANMPELLRGHPARKQRTDQPYMMKALSDSNIKVLPLPSNYNFRYRFPVSIMGSAKIIHGPVPRLGWSVLDSQINVHHLPRVWTRECVNDSQ